MSQVSGGGMDDFVKAARQMESFFLSIMMNSMRKTVKKTGLFSGGQGEETFTEMLDSEISKMASNRGKGLGIADVIIKRYSKYADPSSFKVDNEKRTK